MQQKSQLPDHPRNVGVPRAAAAAGFLLSEQVPGLGTGVKSLSLKLLFQFLSKLLKVSKLALRKIETLYDGCEIKVLL